MQADWEQICSGQPAQTASDDPTCFLSSSTLSRLSVAQCGQRARRKRQTSDAYARARPGMRIGMSEAQYFRSPQQVVPGPSSVPVERNFLGQPIRRVGGREVIVDLLAVDRVESQID